MSHYPSKCWQVVVKEKTAWIPTAVLTGEDFHYHKKSAFLESYWSLKCVNPSRYERGSYWTILNFKNLADAISYQDKYVEHISRKQQLSYDHLPDNLRRKKRNDRVPIVILPIERIKHVNDENVEIW